MVGIHWCLLFFPRAVGSLLHLIYFPFLLTHRYELFFPTYLSLLPWFFLIFILTDVRKSVVKEALCFLTGLLKIGASGFGFNLSSYVLIWLLLKSKVLFYGLSHHEYFLNKGGGGRGL